MRLDFNVLWVDDQPRELDPTFIPLRQRMREQGFEFRPTVKSSMEEVKALVADEVFRDEIDLIVVDHQLGGDLRGEDIIFEVRFSVPHKDIIFYSSYTSPSDLRAEAYKKGIEGVYCADKRAIVDEIMSAFESLVKKVLDLDHTRGIVMGATSDIDRMIHASLAGVTKAEEKKFLLFHARRIVEERIVALNEAAAKLKKANDISSLLEARSLFVASDKLRIFSNLLGQDAYQTHDTLRTSVKAYLTDVLPLRNDLGHLVLIPDGGTAAIAETTGKPMTLESMRLLRRSLLDLRAEMRRFLESVGA